MQKPVRTPLNIAAIFGLLLLTLASQSLPAFAAPARQEPPHGAWPKLILRAEHVDGGSKIKILPSREFLRSDTKSAALVVNYIGDWDPAAQAAFEYAKGIWEAQIASPVPISVDATWEDLNYISPYVLGGASASDYLSNFSGSPAEDTWYPIALANKLANSDLDSSISDIEATFNSGFSAWYFGVDGSPPQNLYDFVSVVIHEIGHGLGFSGSMRVVNQVGNWGVGSDYPFIYDCFVYNSLGSSLLDPQKFPNQSSALFVELTGDNLFFAGARAVEMNGGKPPKIYAPVSWQQGSSFSHLDEKTYPIESGNALMTPALLNGEVIHDPGPIAMGIFDDMGWGSEVHPPLIVAPELGPKISTGQTGKSSQCGAVNKTSTYIPSVLSTFSFQQ